jgi:hypothetical protein
VLQTLDDPIRALKAVRRVAKQLLVLDTVSVPLMLVLAPIARLDRTRILRDRFSIETDWKHRAGIRGRSCAMLAS